MSPVELLHRHIGAPLVEECAPLSKQAGCWLCGGAAVRGRKVAKWVGPAFTSQNRVRNPASDVICEGCVFICGRLSPVPGRPPAEGKTSGGNWRNYSHWMWEVDGEWKYDNASKGEKHKLRAFLAMSKPGGWPSLTAARSTSSRGRRSTAATMAWLRWTMTWCRWPASWAWST
jgi:hypothetical protein